MPSCASSGITSSLKTRVLRVDQRMRLGRERVEVARRWSAARLLRRLDEVGEANLEELVEVGRDDADVAQPLEQRHVVALAPAPARGG